MGWADFAIIEFDELLCEQIEKRKEIFDNTYKQDHMLNEMRFDDDNDTPIWYDTDSLGGKDFNLDDILNDEQQKELDRNGFVQLPMDLEIPESNAKTELEEMIILGNDRFGFVMWSCYTKHSDARSTTISFKIEKIRSLV